MIRAVSTVLVFASLASVTASAAPSPTLAQASARGDVMDWAVLATGQAVVLSVSMPDGTVQRSEFGPGTSPTFSALDKNGQRRPLGTYTWELRLVPNVSPEVRK